MGSLRAATTFDVYSRAAVIVACVMAFGASPAAQTSPPSLTAVLPEGKGRALIERLCSGCHDPSLVIFSREDEEGWAAIVNDMAARGANGTKEELDTITSYLSTHFSRARGFTPLLTSGTAASGRPLDGERRIDAGREIYQTICAMCHQADGRGRLNVAPSLVGSDLLLGTLSKPIRIMLHGKRGSTNVMPALGRLMNDEQIAMVLTYVRAEWGNGGGAVEAAAVGDVRRATDGRSRPWTLEELATVRDDR